MMRNKAYSFINIAGLSIGVACCLMLALYVQNEMSYDKHHIEADNLYRVITHVNRDKDMQAIPRTSPPIVWGVKDEVPEIETVTRFSNPPGVDVSLIKYETSQFYESDGLIADGTFFDIFTYTFVEGNPKNALTEPNSVVITHTLARKLFGDRPGLNKVVNINQGGPSGDYKITGVIADDQPASHVKANFIVSIAGSSGWSAFFKRPDVGEEWAGQNFMYSYIKLKGGHTPEEVTTKINKAFQKHGADDLNAAGMSKTLSLEPVKDIHLYSASGDQSPRIVYLYVIASIGGFILLIACINFMNLSTAKATKRANEVGLRKTLGAHRASLISQFLGEALVIVSLAILLSFALVQFTLPGFNHLTGKTINLTQTNVYFIAPMIIVITIITALISGSYPAFYLSSFQPAKVLKGKSILQSPNSVLRKSLVVFQFVIAIILVCGMVIITRQLKFIREANLGFNADHKIILPLRTGTAKANFIVLNTELSKLSNVNGVSGTNCLPGNTVFTDFFLYPSGGSMEKGVRVRNNWVEPNYLDLLGIKLLAGSRFSNHRDSLSQFRVIINEKTAKEFGLTAPEAVGEHLFTEWQGTRYQFEIIGVMNDYHQSSLKEEIFPVLFRVAEDSYYNYAVVDVKGENFKLSLSDLEKTWKSVNPETPFEYSFLDNDIKKQYVEDEKVSSIITSFTIIATIISCLGLYGLSAFMAERRFKEIGVRKVMGASVQQIVAMMSGEFAKLVLIAFVIAVPISHYAMNRWLEGFAYKTAPDVFLFLIAGGAGLAISILTISFNSIRAASGNPINALRNE